MPTVAAPTSAAMARPSPRPPPAPRLNSRSGCGERWRRTSSGLSWKPPSAISTKRAASMPAAVLTPATLPPSTASASTAEPRRSTPPRAARLRVSRRSRASGPRPFQSRPPRRRRGGAITQRMNSGAPPRTKAPPSARSHASTLPASSARRSASAVAGSPSPPTDSATDARISAAGRVMSRKATCRRPPAIRELQK